MKERNKKPFFLTLAGYQIKRLCQVSTLLVLLSSLGFAASFNVTTTDGGTGAGSLGGAIASITPARINLDDAVTFSALFNAPQTITLPAFGDYSSIVKAVTHTLSMSPAAFLTIIGPTLNIFNFSGGGTFTVNNISVNGNMAIGANTTLAGGLTISANGANLTLAAGSAVSSSLSLAGLLNVRTNGNATISGRIRGAGSLSVAGANILTLSNNTNDYSGGTTIGDGLNGTVSINNAGQLGDVAGALIFNAGTLITSQALNLTITRAITLGGAATINVSNLAATTTLSGIISNAGGLTKVGLGKLVLSGANTYTGGTTVSAGTLQGTPAGIQGNILNNSAVIFTAAGAYAGNMSGIGSLTKINGGALTLSGTNTYTGGTTVSAGTLRGTPTSLQGNIVNDSGVVFTAAGAYAGNMSGIGALTKNNGGTLTLSGINTYSGGTTVNAGTLQGTTTSLQGAITNDANVTFAQAAAGAYAGNMSGIGSLTKTNGGALTLSGTNTYTGGTTVSAGTLQGTTTSLQGNITNNASVIFDQGGAGTYAGNMSGSGSLTINNGTITLSGTNTHSGGTILAGGILQVSNNNQLGSLAPLAGLSFTGGTLKTIVGITSARAITLGGVGGVLDTNGFTSTFTGNMNGTAPLSITGGGIANLNGILSGNMSLSIGGGIVTLGGANTYLGGTTVSAGILQGTTASLQGNITNNASVIFNQIGAGAYAGNMDGTGSLTINNGTITLSGINTHSGGTVLAGGILQISNNNQLGSLAPLAGLSFTGGTLRTTATLSSARLITLGAGGGIFDVANGTITTLSGGFAGTGSLIVIGSGTLALTGPTLPSIGGMNIGLGASLSLSPSVALSYVGSILGAGVLTVGNSNLTLTGSSITGSGYTVPTTIGAGHVLNLAPGGGILTYSGAIGGSGSVAISGGNRVALTAVNTYAGGTEVSDATTLVVSNSNQLGSGPITLDDGILELTANVVQAIHLAAGGGIFDVPVGQTVTLFGALTGGGVLTKTGLGTLIIAGSSLSTGNIIISQGILNLAPSLPVTYAGDISGNGALTVSNNTVTLTGTNTSGGPTTVAGGVLEVSEDVQLGDPGNPPGIPPASVVLSGGILRTTSSLTSDRPISLAGNGRVDVSAGAVTTLTGVITELVPSQLFVTGAGILVPTNIGNNYSVGTNLGANVTLQISDSRELGSGPVTFTGGTLQAVHAAGILTLPHTLNLVGPGALTVLNPAATMALTNTIMGAGLLTMFGPGSFDLTTLTSNTATGGMDLDNTTVFIDAADQLSSGDLTFNNGNLQAEHTAGTLALPHTLNLIGPGALTVLNPAATMALTDTIMGAGLLTMAGPGSFDLTTLTSNTATGGMTLDNTTVFMDAANQLSSGGLTFNNGNLQAEHIASTLTLAQVLNLVGVSTLTVSDASAHLALTGSATGAGDFILSGPGNFDLRGLTNGATGTLTIDDATVLIDQASQLGAGNFLSLVQGILLTTQGVAVPLTLPQDIALGASGGTVEVFTAGATTTLSGLISGGPLTVSGLGTVVLGNAGNSYNGTTINAGATLSITSAGNLGSPTGFLNLMGGTLNVGGVSMMGPRRRAALLSLSQPVNLNGGGTFDVNGGQAISLDGPISGTGPLSIIGGGMVSLIDSNNSYTGGTEVSEDSTLSVSADGQLGDSAGDVTLDGATFQATATFTSARPFTLGPLGGFVDVVSASATTTLSNGIAGNGPLTKIGDGTLSLGGNSTASATTVNQGTFLLSGSLASPVTVDSGAFFGGTGNITGDVNNSGTFAPQGNFVIDGNLTTTATSVYVCNVSPAGVSDHLEVTGDAQLAGNLQVVTTSGTYTVGTIYTILTAATRNGTFSNILPSTFGFSFQPTYGNDEVKLTLTATPSGPTPPVISPSPPVAPSRGVVQVLSNTGNVVATVVSSQISSTGALKVSHYDDGFHFSPVDFAPSQGSLPKRHASDRAQAYGESLQSIFHILSQKGPMMLERHQNRLWISPYSSYGRSDVDETTKATNRDEGILVGFDWRSFSPTGSLSSLFGLFVGGGKGKQSTPSDTPQDNTVDSKSVILGFYHSLGFWEDGRYDLIINGVGSRRRSKRFGDQDGVGFRADGKFNSYDITGNLSTSWVFHLPQHFSIRPNIGIATGYSHQDPFTESNADTSNQRYASSRKHYVEPYVGIGVRHEWKSDSYVVKLTGVVEQGYKIFRDNNNTRFFSATGPVEGTTVVPLRAGPSATHLTTYGSILDVGANFKYILGYTATVQKHATSHTLTVKCEYRF